MSSINFSSMNALPLASSVAGGQQARPEQNSSRAEAARQDFRATLESLSARTTGDVDETTLESDPDRDADGRDLSGFFQEEEARPAQPEKNSPAPARPHPVDTNEEVGRLLDFDA